jgi:serine/threonine protein kinase
VGYKELLHRSADFFEFTTAKLNYYGVITDLEHITFFQIKKNSTTAVSTLYDGNYQLGGNWNDHTLSFDSSLPDVPKGFKKLISFILETMKANALPSLLLYDNDMINSQSYQITRILGRGRKSIVYAAVDENKKKVCVKLEPILEATQIKNEEVILKLLTNCTGVPKLLYSGKAKFLGERYYAVVTDVIGEYTLRDCGDKDDIELQKIASRCIDILQEIHRKGILHRDIKPNHIIFSKDELYIIDFGVAGERESDTLYVTPEYSATCADFVSLDESSDFESLWFCLLSLRQPLPWKYTLSNSYETWILKNQHSPHHMIDRYPLLIQPFLALGNDPEDV